MNVAIHLVRLIKVISLITYKARTRKEILQKLEKEEFFLSDRTFDRVIESIRELGYDVNFKKGFGYRIINDEKEDDDLQLILNLNNFISSHRKLNNLSSSDLIIQESPATGINFLPVVLDALLHQTALKIEYKKHSESESTDRIIYPLKLVQTENRWYLIAVNENMDGTRTFGFDRFQDIQQMGKFEPNFIPQHLLDEVELFKHKIGVSEPLFKDEPDKIYEITLAVKDFLIPYIQSKKIHFTQQITDEKIDGFTLVKINVIPNRDLLKRVARELGDIKIVEPKNMYVI